MSKRPNFVALSEVNEHSERIIIGDMGLPVGFDQERLLVQLPRLERIASLACMSTLTLAGFRGDTSEYSYGIGGMSSDGVASAVSSKIISRAGLSDSDVDRQGEDIPRGFRWSDASIKINNAEIEERIRSDGDKWDKNVFDEIARAKYMSDALQRGLIKSIHTSIFPEEPFVQTVTKSAALKALDVAWYDLWLPGNAQAAFVVSTVISTLSPMLAAMFYRSIGRELPPAQWSLSDKIHYDRYVAAQGLNAVSRLVRSRK